MCPGMPAVCQTLELSSWVWNSGSASWKYLLSYKEGILVTDCWAKLEDESIGMVRIKAQNSPGTFPLRSSRNSTPLIFSSATRNRMLHALQTCTYPMHPAASREKESLRWKHAVCWYRKYVRRITRNTIISNTLRVCGMC